MTRGTLSTLKYSSHPPPLTRCRGPPAPGVVVKELHADHCVDIVPLAKYDHIEAEVCNVLLQLLDLLSVG